MDYDYEKEIQEFEDEFYCGYDEYFDGNSYIPRERQKNYGRVAQSGQSPVLIPQLPMVQIHSLLPMRPYRLVVRTSPFHGDNVGSTPARVTNYARLVQLVERLAYIQKVVGSSPTASTILWGYDIMGLCCTCNATIRVRLSVPPPFMRVQFSGRTLVFQTNNEVSITSTRSMRE